jgi:hypothetical protein
VNGPYDYLGQAILVDRAKTSLRAVSFNSLLYLFLDSTRLGCVWAENCGCVRPNFRSSLARLFCLSSEFTTFLGRYYCPLFPGRIGLNCLPIGRVPKPRAIPSIIHLKSRAPIHACYSSFLPQTADDLMFVSQRR